MAKQGTTWLDRFLSDCPPEEVSQPVRATVRPKADSPRVPRRPLGKAPATKVGAGT